VLQEVWEWVRSIIIAIILALLFRMFLVEHFLVDGQSMYPTLQDNERIIVNKLVYRLQEPEYGEIIVFEYQDNRDFIKRVVGEEGDKIKIDDNQLYVNSNRVEEPYIKKNSVEDYGPVTVPEDHYFVLGDNRANSRDSRYDDVGHVSMEEIKGRAAVVFWPLDRARFIE